MEGEEKMVQSNTEQAGLGLRSPDYVEEDDFILPIWTSSGALVTIGFAIIAGPGGLLAGLGLSGLFLFIGVIIETAMKRNRK